MSSSTPTQSQAQPGPISIPNRRPLQREGAVVFLSRAEQALQDAMLRSSPTPEPVLGKRTHQDEDTLDGNDTEPDGEGSLTQTSSPSISNVTAATLRYATRKKLRPEQRDDLQNFLLVSLRSIFVDCV